MDRAQENFPAGNGNDSVTLLAAADYKIENSDSNITVSGSADDDSVINYGTNVYISLGAGEDKVTMSGAHGTTVDAGTDDDWLLSNSSSSVSINGGAGNDSIDAMGAKITLIGGSGNDYLRNKVGTGTLDGGAGNDTIIAMGTSYIDAGDDDDRVTVFAGGTNSTILGGKGNDYIQNLANNVTFIHKLGDGNNSIDGFRANSTLQVGSTYTKSTVEGNVLVQTNDGTSILLDAATLDTINVVVEDSSAINLTDDANVYMNSVAGVKINALGGNDSIENDGSQVTIDAGAGNDVVENVFSQVTINGGDGNDSIRNVGSQVTISAGAGNDTIYNGYDGESVAINGSDGNDFISNDGEWVTINGGAGVDLISLSGSYNLIEFVQNDGGDSIIGFNETDTLKIGNGTSDTFCSVVSGSDVNVSVGNNVITLSGAASLSSLHIAGTYSEIRPNSWTIAGNTARYGTSTNTLITITGVADGATASNFYVKGTRITIGKDAVQTDGTPLELLTDGYTLKLGKGMGDSETVKANYNASTMTYTTAGRSNGYTLSDDKQSITCTAGTTKEIEFLGVASDATASNFYVKGKTITIGKDAVQTDGTPLELLTDGYTLNLGRGMGDPTNDPGTLKNGIYTFGGKTEGYSLSTDKKIINYTAGSPQLKLSGVASEPAAPSGGSMTLTSANFSDNLSVLSNAGDYSFAVTTGNYGGKTFTGNSAVDFISNTGSNININSGGGNDYIKSSGSNVVIDGGAGADTILSGRSNDSLSGGADNDSINGGAGSDTLWGGTGNDTLTGGSGSDIFIYRPNEGKDTITDYTSGELLQILNADGSAGTFSGSSFSGSKLTLTIDGGSVIFNNVSASTSFNINGTTHTISGGRLV